MAPRPPLLLLLLLLPLAVSPLPLLPSRATSPQLNTPLPTLSSSPQPRAPLAPPLPLRQRDRAQADLKGRRGRAKGAGRASRLRLGAWLQEGCRRDRPAAAAAQLHSTTAPQGLARRVRSREVRVGRGRLLLMGIQAVLLARAHLRAILIRMGRTGQASNIQPGRQQGPTQRRVRLHGMQQLQSQPHSRTQRPQGQPLLWEATLVLRGMHILRGLHCSRRPRRYPRWYRVVLRLYRLPVTLLHRLPGPLLQQRGQQQQRPRTPLPLPLALQGLPILQLHQQHTSTRMGRMVRLHRLRSRPQECLLRQELSLRVAECALFLLLIQRPMLKRNGRRPLRQQ
jgi:hypothetical protein